MKKLKWFHYALIGAGLLLAIKIYKSAKNAGNTVTDLLNGFKNSGQASALKGAMNGAGFDVNSATANAIVDKADKIYKAIYKNDIFGWFEDEETIISTFNSLSSIAEAKALSGVYQTNYNNSLYSDLKKALASSEMNQLKQYLLNAVK